MRMARMRWPSAIFFGEPEIRDSHFCQRALNISTSLHVPAWIDTELGAEGGASRFGITEDTAFRAHSRQAQTRLPLWGQTRSSPFYARTSASARKRHMHRSTQPLIRIL